MSKNIVQTVSLTTQCSGGCVHCPYSNPELEKLYLSPRSIENILNKSDKLFVLSGGEPFEHTEISPILNFLENQSKKFRIATGGHIDLSPWIKQLKRVMLKSEGFLGLSLGTDVISNRNSNHIYLDIWSKNILLLSQFKIPYSITLTIDKEFRIKNNMFFFGKKILNQCLNSFI